MGKIKPSILSGLFSHLSMGKNKNSNYEDLRHVSPQSKLKKKSRGKKLISSLSSKLEKVKSAQQNEALLSPSTSTTPLKKREPKRKSNIQNIISNTRSAFTSPNKYNEISESPVPHMKREKFKNSKSSSLRERMVSRLKAARFRYMNEQLYISESNRAGQLFMNDPKAFSSYHEGFKQQVAQWPVNPLDIIIKTLKKRAKSSKNLVIADFGCGEAKLAQSLPCTVHSLDLVALNELVTVCNMAHTPLADGSVDIAVFCLSLMGINLVDYIREANRVLKEGGLMKIAEIESRFEDLNSFIHGVERMGFQIITQDVTHNLFYFLEFKKTSNTSKKKKKIIPELTLKPCMYKKR